MNKDDVIRMARGAGLLRAGDGWTEPHRWGETEVSKFAALAFAAGAAHEREECAKVCEEPIDEIQITDDCSEVIYKDNQDCAAAIRARGEMK